ncbi:hypothetical protein MIND_00675400 [Mycena indigotica]|uniref:Uncharacterized protein n=1 Tax=Mycena indigotica TaxID=2126181 RepID=A0A8H6SKP0_9AGAR|nr:uncharacterized protein MIND_00675400 [Mycena indigotica]KAF7301114.1 hypothetical protein MIND_00675400 [Mycena indigotica]
MGTGKVPTQESKAESEIPELDPVRTGDCCGGSSTTKQTLFKRHNSSPTLLNRSRLLLNPLRTAQIYVVSSSYCLETEIRANHGASESKSVLVQRDHFERKRPQPRGTPPCTQREDYRESAGGSWSISCSGNRHKQTALENVFDASDRTDFQLASNLNRSAFAFASDNHGVVVTVAAVIVIAVAAIVVPTVTALSVAAIVVVAVTSIVVIAVAAIVITTMAAFAMAAIIIIAVMAVVVGPIITTVAALAVTAVVVIAVASVVITTVAAFGVAAIIIAVMAVVVGAIVTSMAALNGHIQLASPRADWA